MKTGIKNRYFVHCKDDLWKMFLTFKNAKEYAEAFLKSTSDYSGVGIVTGKGLYMIRRKKRRKT